MQPVMSFRDLEVWQLGMDQVVAVYRRTDRLPSPERFGLTAQIRRAAVSVPSNIAEGHARRSDGAYLNHVRIAIGSQAELDTQIEVALRLGFIDQASAQATLAEIARLRQMLCGLRRSLERRRQAAAGLTSAGILGLLIAVLLA